MSPWFCSWAGSPVLAEQSSAWLWLQLPTPAACELIGTGPTGARAGHGKHGRGTCLTAPPGHTERRQGFSQPPSDTELTRIKSILCRNISAVFWDLELHNIKNIQQYNILFAFSKARILVWNIISHKNSSKTPHVFKWGWNFLTIWFQRYFKSWSQGRQGNLSFSPFLLFSFSLFPFSFFLSPST